MDCFWPYLLRAIQKNFGWGSTFFVGEIRGGRIHKTWVTSSDFKCRSDFCLFQITSSDYQSLQTALLLVLPVSPMLLGGWKKVDMKIEKQNNNKLSRVNLKLENYLGEGLIDLLTNLGDKTQELNVSCSSDLEEDLLMSTLLQGMQISTSSFLTLLF